MGAAAQGEQVDRILKWAGGKMWLAPRIKEMYAPYASGRRSRRFVDLFAGGLSVSLSVNPANALVNDINPHVINLYRWARIGFDGDASFCADCVPFINERGVFERNRARFNELIASRQCVTPEAALLFWYLNRTSYNGLCRFNKKGFFNAPFGAYKSIDYARLLGRMKAYRDKFLRWRLVCRDFAKVPLVPGDFVYADPPYDSEKPGAFVGYAAGGFGWDDQVRLAALLAGHDGPVIASNSATPRVVALYAGKGFHIEYVDAPRRISCTGDRTPVREILATKGL